MNKYIGIVFLALLISSCRNAKEYVAPKMIFPASYRGQENPDSASIAHLPWKQLFTDTLLRALITQGLAKNLDLKIALKQIEIAHAALQQSKAAFLPDLSVKTGLTASKLAFPQGFGLRSSSTQYDLFVNTSWEADIWGKLKSAKKAALARLLQSQEAKRAVQTQLIADISNAYFTLLAMDQQLRVLEKTLVNRKEDVKAMKSLMAANIVNGAAEVQSEANQYSAEASIPRLKRQIREMENALSTLLSRPARQIKRSSLDGQRLDVRLQAGMPVQLLQNRPDVKQAEYAYRAAFEDTNVARRAFYPSLSLTASGGFSNFNFRDWLAAPGLFGNVAAGILQPVLNKGQNKARLKTALALKEQALYTFEKSVLSAGEEVSNALYAWETAVEQYQIRRRQITALEKAVDFTKKLLKYSSATNYTDVLSSEQGLLAAELDGVNDQLEQWRAVVALYRAIGGGSI